MSVRLFFISIGLMLLILLIASIIAFNPVNLWQEKPNLKKPPVVKWQEPKTQENPPPQNRPSDPSVDLMSTLAPDSFAPPQSLGGVGFSGQGSGFTAGGGGFGSSQESLARSKESINRPPRLLSSSPPTYPISARDQNIKGYVLLKILVGVSGGVEKVEVQESVPSGFFETAARNAVKKWRFEPGIVQGQQVATWTLQKIKFELN